MKHSHTDILSGQEGNFDTREGGTLSEIITEGFMFVGWVAMWRAWESILMTGGPGMKNGTGLIAWPGQGPGRDAGSPAVTPS